MLKKWIFIVFLFLFTNNIYAVEEYTKTNITINDNTNYILNDESVNNKIFIDKSDELVISADEYISSIYIIFDSVYESGVLYYNNQVHDFNDGEYLHKLINLEEETKEIKITFNSGVQVREIYAFCDNTLPSWVQNWDTLNTNADMMLFTTHSDDEHLFFAGLLPTYIDKGYKVQVVYFTNHLDASDRLHEQLNGLWTSGVTYYPVMGKVKDAWSNNYNTALLNSGFTEEELVSDYVNIINTYNPLIIFGHDEDGEYSHGQHILNAKILEKAAIITDATSLYLHLYDENPIIMDYDIKLDTFDGLTAYEVSKNSYTYHLSQQYTWFTDWLNGNPAYTSATQIKSYSPLNYGLYYGVTIDEVELLYEERYNAVSTDNETEKNTETENSVYEINSINNKNYNNYIYIVLVLVILIIVTSLFKLKKKK